MTSSKRNISEKEWKEMGDKFKDVREEKNLTQEDVAAEAGITTSYYARIERGEERPTLDTIKGLVKSLKVKISDILPF